MWDILCELNLIEKFYVRYAYCQSDVIINSDVKNNNPTHDL